MAQEIKSLADLLKTKREDGTYGAFTRDREQNFYYSLKFKKEDFSATSSCHHMTLDPLMVIIFEGNAMENLQQLASALGVGGNSGLEVLKSVMRITTKKDVPSTETTTFSIINFIIITGIEYEYYAETFRYIYQFPSCPDFLKEKSNQTYINSEATKRLAKSYSHGADNEFFGPSKWIPLGLMNDILEKENSPTAYYDIVFLNMFSVTATQVTCYGVVVTMERLFRYVWGLFLNGFGFNLQQYLIENKQYDSDMREQHRYSVLLPMERFFDQSSLVTKAGKSPVRIVEIERLVRNTNIYSNGLLIDEAISEKNNLLDDMLTRLLRGYFINHLPPLLDMILRLYDCIHTLRLSGGVTTYYYSTKPEESEVNDLRLLVNGKPPSFSLAPPFPPIVSESSPFPPIVQQQEDDPFANFFKGTTGTAFNTAPETGGFREVDSSNFFPVTSSNEPYVRPARQIVDPLEDLVEGEEPRVSNSDSEILDALEDEDTEEEF